MITKSAHSPWTSRSTTERRKRTSCSTTPSSYNPAIHSAGQVDTKHLGNYELKIEEFSASDEDQFIPFDPPLVSRFGPISRMARSLIRGAAPIQVSATINSGMIALTPVVQQPMPSTGSTHNWYWQSTPGTYTCLFVNFAAKASVITINKLHCY